MTDTLPRPKARRTASGEREAAVGGAAAPDQGASRLAVRKTYKLYIGGQFPRSESGRSDPALAADGSKLALICRASRKDLREAVVAARGAFAGWSRRSGYNRGQILYRAAELLEGRAAQLAHELAVQGAQDAEGEVRAAVDRTVYYAGWCDKVQQVFSAVNPVASSHFCFSLLEPTGVVAIVAPAESGLLGLVSVLMPVLAGGNTAVMLASGRYPLAAVTFAEVLHASDLPAGVVNTLTGRRGELLEHMASHLDTNAVWYCGGDTGEATRVEQLGAENTKRIKIDRRTDWADEQAQSPYRIVDFQEVKTTWHPIGS